MNLPTIKEILETHRLHATGSRRGYLSRKGKGSVEPYTGRYGVGYRVILPRWDTTQYVTVQYYIWP